MSQIILYVLYQNGQFSTTEQISNSVADMLSTPVDSEQLTIALQDLKSTARIVESTLGAFKIVEEQRAVLKGELEDATRVASLARASFIERVMPACPNIDPEQCWDNFHQQCLLPLVLDMGARTYEFVSMGTLHREVTFEDTDFFKSYDPKDREALRTVILDYLTPNDEVVREFMLRTLNAAFFLEASGLQGETLEKLASSGASLRPLTLFLDTNLLFSVMELHENPSNQSVYSLFQVMDESAEAISCRLYVLPVTVEEFKRTLIANRESLKRIAQSPNLLAAARSSGRFSGLKLRFMEAYQGAVAAISPEDYFNPYISSPASLLATKGVELLNEEMYSYESRQDVVDGINRMWESEEDYRKTDWRYRAIQHDMMLWHFVNDRRPAYVESLSEAGSWIVTIDYRLLRYDRDAHNRNTGKPNCIHPSVLVQMLRFWLPRSDVFESAVLESLRVPFIFRSFDAESEAVALRILEVLARFEVGDISPEAIRQLLVDDALDMAFRKPIDEELETELLTEKLSSMESSLRDDLRKSLTEAEEHRGVVEQQREQLIEEAKLLHLEQEKREQFEARLAYLEEANSATSATRGKRMFLLKWVGLAMLAAVSATIVAWAVTLMVGFNAIQSLLVMFGASGISGLVVIRIADWQGGKVPEFENWPHYQRLLHLRRQLYALLGLVTLGTITAAIWDMLKSVF